MDLVDADDPMEIEETIPTTPIIERKSDELKFGLTISEANANSVKNEPKIDQEKIENNSNSADIVVLDDDDEMQGIEEGFNKGFEIIDLVEKPGNGRCLNPSCELTTTEFIRAPCFCISYYRVKKEKMQGEEICMMCYNKAVKDFDKLVTGLKDGNLVLQMDYPIINETLQIDDSDEESGPQEKDKAYFDKENFNFISENIDNVIMSTLDKFNVVNQIKKEMDYVKEEEERISDKFKLLQTQTKQIRKSCDNIQSGIYNGLCPSYKHLKNISIYDDQSFSTQPIIRAERNFEQPRKSTRLHKPISYAQMQEGISVLNLEIAGNKECEIPKDLPPTSPVVKPKPEIGQIFYIIRENNQGSWIRARLNAIIEPNTAYNGVTYPEVMYKLTELKKQKERILNGKNIAYLTEAKVRLSVGMRVISVFKNLTETGDEMKLRHNPYYAGIVAEIPLESNKFRYLIFFDIGYAQYVSYKSVNLVLESSTNVWEDVMEDSKLFIQTYLESQDRPMVKTASGDTLHVEYNGKWWKCSVKDVDCALVKVSFHSLNRNEWIYRGSTRLSPLFREQQAATNRHTAVRSRKVGQYDSATVVQYTKNTDYVQPTVAETQSTVRAVARKSTTRPQGNVATPNIIPFLPPANTTTTNNSVSGPTSKIMYFTPRDQEIIKSHYKPHMCSPKCKDYLTHNFCQLRGHNPLSKPLLCGWARMTVKAKGRKEIVYKAPCGRLLRNMAEVHLYLMKTKSEMTVDLFDFNHMVRCLAEFSVECSPDPKDLSRGLEQVPIPVINGIGKDILDFCNYSIKRLPMEGVHLNLDPEFLSGCDCEDDCSDKTKCACWKLTLEGAKYTSKDGDPNSIGYNYRRLPEQVITGIYECNSRCKCSSTCLNRVVQNPMSLKLQVFKTLNRGWGIRCLNDIPQGSFICIYAGTIHTEAMANEDGIANGDEYFAELDYIETVEKCKEDYEADVVEDDFNQKSPKDDDEDDEQFIKNKKCYNDNEFTASFDKTRSKESYITTRLRKRNDEDKSDHHTVKIKKELTEKIDIKATLENLSGNIETVTISDEEDEGREVLSFNPKSHLDEKESSYTSVRQYFGKDESVYVMDAKNAGNIGRFLNHSCSPNVFVQNVFVDTHDLRFPWVSFFSSQFIRAGTELTWNYSYDIGSVPGRILYCYCASLECKGRLL